jgi:hypothetical protein
MSGYRPDEPQGSGDAFELKTFSFLLLGPALLGLFLLIEGLAGGGRVEAAIGALLLASAPLAARWAWRGGMWN